MLAIAIVVVAMPGGTGRGFHLEQGVNDFGGVADARVIGRAQTKTHQRQRIGTYQMAGPAGVLGGRHILDAEHFPASSAPSAPVCFGAMRT